MAKRALQQERAAKGAGRRGPVPLEGSYRDQRRELQAERAVDGVGSRGPKPIATDIQRQGYPFPDEEGLTPEDAMAHYFAFTRSWCKFGLSRACEMCGTLATARFYKQSKATGKMMCKTCRENATKILLPDLLPIPEALQGLQPIEQHLIAMARISQVLLDKLPAGGPSAQWGRMYAVLMEDPLICDVLAGATLQDDGTVLVEGVQGLMASPASSRLPAQSFGRAQKQSPPVQGEPRSGRNPDENGSHSNQQLADLRRCLEGRVWQIARRRTAHGRRSLSSLGARSKARRARDDVPGSQAFQGPQP